MHHCFIYMYVSEFNIQTEYKREHDLWKVKHFDNSGGF